MSQKLKNSFSNSKLATALNSFEQENSSLPKMGFNTKNNTKNIKTISIRLRESDFQNLSKISKFINEQELRRNFSQSQIIRGLINFSAENYDKINKKILNFIKDSF